MKYFRTQSGKKLSTLRHSSKIFSLMHWLNWFPLLTRPAADQQYSNVSQHFLFQNILDNKETFSFQTISQRPIPYCIEWHIHYCVLVHNSLLLPTWPSHTHTKLRQMTSYSPLFTITPHPPSVVAPQPYMEHKIN